MIKLLENFWLKIIALIMGLLIWFHVATEKIYNYELQLPVIEVDLKDSLTLAKNPPDSLMVTVSAKGKQLLRREWRESGLRINATRYTAGNHRVNLDIDNTFLTAASQNITLDDIVYPTQVTFSIDFLGEAVIPVTVDVVPEPDDGFAVQTPIRTDPTEVTLIGPRSLLRDINTVFTEKRVLSGLRNDISLTLPLLPPSNYGMRLHPDSVTLSLEVVPVKTRVFENVPVVVFNVPPGFTCEPSPVMVSVELTGPPEVIDQLERGALTVSADYRQVDEFGVCPLRFDYPSGFKLRRSSHGTVRIIVAADADAGN